MHRQELLNRLNFNDYTIVDEQIEPVPVVKLDFVIEDRHNLLRDDLEPGLPQFMDEAGAIHAFQKTWSEL